MPNVKLTRNEIEAIKLAIESDIEVSECDVPDYKDVWQMTYYMHRASALHKITCEILGLD
jgi:predicted DNA-binding protein (UPF0251 family)